MSKNSNNTKSDLTPFTIRSERLESICRDNFAGMWDQKSGQKSSDWSRSAPTCSVPFVLSYFCFARSTDHHNKGPWAGLVFFFSLKEQCLRDVLPLQAFQHFEINTFGCSTCHVFWNFAQEFLNRRELGLLSVNLTSR